MRRVLGLLLSIGLCAAGAWACWRLPYMGQTYHRFREAGKPDQVRIPAVLLPEWKANNPRTRVLKVEDSKHTPGTLTITFED
jgi:hypothetical protein